MAVKVEVFEAGQVAKLRRDRTGQADAVGQRTRAAQDQVGELRSDVSEFGRDRSREVVTGQVEVDEAVELAYFGGDRAGELVAPGELQAAEAGKTAEGGRDCAIDVGAVEVQFSHAAHAVNRADLDPGPVREGGIGVPVERGRAAQGVSR